MRGVLDRFQQWQRPRDLIRERRVLGVLQRDEQEVRGNEGRVLCMCDPNRSLQDA